MRGAAFLLGAAVFVASCALPEAERAGGAFENELPRTLEECYAQIERFERAQAEERAKANIFGALYKTLQGGAPPMTRSQCQGRFRVPDAAAGPAGRSGDYDQSRVRGGASGVTGVFDYGIPGCRRLNHAVHPSC